MAVNKNNIITRGMSGMLGQQLVFRQFKDGRLGSISAAPKTPAGPPTEKQKAVRERFQQAIIYGKSVYTADPLVKESYAAAAEPGQSPYNVAVADFFNAPEIEEVDLSNYFGKVGDTISVRVTDDFKVKSVTVKIQNPDATLVEEGNAVLGINGLDWVFTATAVNSVLAGDKLTITAKDTPDNKTKKETLLT